eukprot:TRINITY_DN136438_c0_g1_i1.p1 TRINITY_DN136438_c0_g1~~TRINITY_DN136438_c0_g1_i1.p1  ORF type:complete len:94 (+),score=8.60 TRINITY_DN136438_c0_g1_i1:39-320(+)
MKYLVFIIVFAALFAVVFSVTGSRTSNSPYPYTSLADSNRGDSSVKTTSRFSYTTELDDDDLVQNFDFGSSSGASMIGLSSFLLFSLVSLYLF